MPRISLTDFVDIVSASGTSKLSKIRQVKKRPDYHPAFDYYKQLREHIIEVHKKGCSKSDLLGPELLTPDAKKQGKYVVLLNGYKKFWGKKQIKWFEPPDGNLSAHGIDVNLNPELGLIWDNQQYVVKLYFKAETLTKYRVDVILHLMKAELHQRAPEGAIFSVLDIRNSKLILPTVDIPDISLALDGELAYIASVWEKFRYNVHVTER